MPEIPQPQDEFTRYAKTLRKEYIYGSGEIGYRLSDRDVELALQLFDKEAVGWGCECVVVDIDGSPDKVNAFTYGNLSPQEAKRNFYLQRILSTFYPHNFPHFYAAFGTNDPEPKILTGTIRKKILHHEGQASSYNNRKRKIKYPFPAIDDISEQMGIPITLDHTGQNFVLGIDGGIYYLDKPSIADRSWNLTKLNEYMEENGYDSSIIKSVKTCVQRLSALGVVDLI